MAIITTDYTVNTVNAIKGINKISLSSEDWDVNQVNIEELYLDGKKLFSQRQYDSTYTSEQFTTLANSKIGKSIVMLGDNIIVSSPNYDKDVDTNEEGIVLSYNTISDTPQDVRSSEYSVSEIRGFGEYIASDGNYLLVGAPLDSEGNTEAGAIYVFEKIKDEDGNYFWGDDYKIILNDATVNDNVGSQGSFDVSGDYIVIGVAARNKVVVYKKNENEWELFTEYVDTNLDGLGYLVGIDGDQIIATDEPGRSGNGKLYTYHFNLSDEIVLAQKITIAVNTITTTGTKYGQLKLKNGTCAIGFPTSGGLGEAVVLLRVENFWIRYKNLSTYITNPNSDNFGVSVDLFENYILVGESGNGDTTTHTYGRCAHLFQVLDDRILYIKEFRGDETATSGQFGSAVGINKQGILISAPLENENGITDPGILYFFPLKYNQLKAYVVVEENIPTVPKIPTGFIASYNDYEEEVHLSWDEVTSSSGYEIYRDRVLINTITSSSITTWVDNTGDGLQHAYIVYPIDANSSDTNIEQGSGVFGKGYSILTENIVLSSNTSQTVNTGITAFDINLQIASIAGGRGQDGNIGTRGLGGVGTNWTGPIIEDGEHEFYFRSGSASTSRSGGIGFFNGGGGASRAGGGGASSGIKLDNVFLCGAGGGGGGGNVANGNTHYWGGGGGGVYGAGTTGGIEVIGYGGDGGGGRGGLGSTSESGSAVVNLGSFSSTSQNNSGHGYINATLTWKE